MWLTRLGEYVTRGFKEAALFALIFSLIPLMGWAGIVIMALITLRKSPQLGLGILLICSAPSLLMLGFGVNVPLVIAVLIGNILTWVLAVTLRETVNWSMVFLATLVFAIVAVCFLHLIIPNIHNFWLEFLPKFYKQANIDTNALFAGSGNDLKSNLLLAAKMTTPIIVLLQVVQSLTNLVIARWWQANMFNPGGLSKELLNIRLSIWATAALAATAAAIYLGVVAGWDVLPVILLLFFLAGLVVLHNLLKRTKANPIGVWLFFGVVILLSLYSASVRSILFISIIMIIGLGITNTFVDFRAKKA